MDENVITKRAIDLRKGDLVMMLHEGTKTRHIITDISYAKMPINSKGYTLHVVFRAIVTGEKWERILKKLEMWSSPVKEHL